MFDLVGEDTDHGEGDLGKNIRIVILTQEESINSLQLFNASILDR